MAKYKPSSEFIKQGGSGVSWKYQEEKVGSVFFGVFTGMDQDVGENHSNLYHFNRFKDDTFKEEGFVGACDIWGSSLLDLRFKNLVRGDQVVVEYLGSEKSEKRKGKEYHNFDVYVRHLGKETTAPELEDKDETDDIDFDLGDLDSDE